MNTCVLNISLNIFCLQLKFIYAKEFKQMTCGILNKIIKILASYKLFNYDTQEVGILEVVIYCHTMRLQIRLFVSAIISPTLPVLW